MATYSWYCPHCHSTNLYAVYNVPSFAPLKQGLPDCAEPVADYFAAEDGDAGEDTYSCGDCEADNITPICVKDE